MPVTAHSSAVEPLRRFKNGLDIIAQTMNRSPLARPRPDLTFTMRYSRNQKHDHAWVYLVHDSSAAKRSRSLDSRYRTNADHHNDVAQTYSESLAEVARDQFKNHIDQFIRIITSLAPPTADRTNGIPTNAVLTTATVPI